jgi:hypothetical protein
LGHLSEQIAIFTGNFVSLRIENSAKREVFGRAFRVGLAVLAA